MRLLELLRRETGTLRRDIFLAAGLSGLAGAGILAIINAAAAKASPGSMNFTSLAMFAVVLAIYILCLRFTFLNTNRIFEEAVHRIRVRIADKIRTNELAVIESVGRNEIYNGVTQETRAIADSAGVLTAAFQAVVMVGFASLYVAFLSLPAFVVTVTMVGAGLAIYMRRDKETKAGLQQATEREIEFVNTVGHSLDGFKEAALSRQRASDLFAALERISTALRDVRVHTMDVYNLNYIFSQVFFYVLIATIVFLLPRVISEYTEVVAKVTTTILFVIGPLSLVVGSVPALMRANIAAESVYKLEHALDNLAATPGPAVTPRTDFKTIRLDRVEFAYRGDGDVPFSIGPISVEIPRGEFLFITGGNGSGKSTLLKVLTGLYHPGRGRLMVDGVVAEGAELQAYRELFTAIFSDFHLFDRLYGLLGTNPERVRELLAEVQLDSKVDFRDDRFSTLDLSTGQRKRLALVVCLLDDRPIMVFDELAADQDPEFRKYLYETLLPGLKKKGKTVIAVTHDDRYYHVADRVLKMQDGQFEPTHAVASGQ